MLRHRPCSFQAVQGRHRGAVGGSVDSTAPYSREDAFAASASEKPPVAASALVLACVDGVTKSVWVPGHCYCAIQRRHIPSNSRHRTSSYWK